MCVLQRPVAPDQALDGVPARALGRVEAAGAVERGNELVVAVELGEREPQRCSDAPAHRQAVAGRVERPRTVCDPRRGGEGVALERGDLVRTRETPPRPAQAEERL